MSTKAAVFLDRDGTINIEAGYIRDLENFQLMPGVGEAIRGLNALGILVIVVTNQSGVARGYYPESWLDQLHGRMKQLLKAEGASLDAIYYCPHLPDGKIKDYSFDCHCRKPEPGMLEEAQTKFSVDFSRSFMIGDKATDVDVGKRVGCQSILLRSGYGAEVLAGKYQHIPNADYIMDDLAQAYQEVLKPFYSR